MRLRLRLRRLRLRQSYKTWLGIENRHKMQQFMTHSVHIFSNKNRTESFEQDSLNMSLNFSSFQKFSLLLVG
jgi:hypothetical protein